MKEIISDPSRIAFCGLYCGACKKFLSDKCPGCQQNQKASWCKVRTCCMELGIKSCADCTEKAPIEDCKKLDSFMAKVFGFFFNSDRMACLKLIKDEGYDAYAEKMAQDGKMTIPRS